MKHTNKSIDDIVELERENEKLKREIRRLKKELAKMELKVPAPVIEGVDTSG